jgi:predicted ATPase
VRRDDLPSGTVTFLFTDVEGSTKLLHELGAQGYAAALAEHRRILRQAFALHGGVEVDTQGDAFFVAFPSARGAIDAAARASEELAAGPIRVRMGIHTGTAHLAEEGYVGIDVHRAARIGACGHGGQVVVSAATARLLEANGLEELGEHRLKDFDEPVALFQLGNERFPPLKSISNTNLPRPASSFVGRQAEVKDITGLLSDGARLLTLTGPGGSGKTRLAIEAAAELVPEFKAGVFWVALATLRDPALVLETIAQTLGAKDGLADHIGERELLLLLDNVEQVVAAAPQLASLVEACPNLKLLVTSRERLQVRGEVAYQVLPLAEPDAVELFCARARTEADGAVDQLCRALDNLPLAVELAAARASVLSPSQMLERLSARLDLLKGGRDADPRQQTLRATIEWSYDLLSPDEQLLFARLAVFRGGCTLAAAEEVAEADLDVLQSLVDKSLVRVTDERFWMLETIREYAAERLHESGEAGAVARRHAEHFLALAEAAEPNLFADTGTWTGRLVPEHDNIRAALDWLADSGETQLALRLAGAVSVFWEMKGHIAEGRRRLEALLSADDRPTAARAKALYGAAAVAEDSAIGKRRAQEAIELHEALGDMRGAAISRLELALVHTNDGEWARARDLLDESGRVLDQVGDVHHATLATRYLAWMHNELGDRQRAREVHERNLQRARATGSRWIEASTLSALGEYAVDDGRIDDALSMLTESTRMWQELDDPVQLSNQLYRWAKLLAAEGRAATAAVLFGSGDALREEVGDSVTPWLQGLNDWTLAAIREKLDEAAIGRAMEEGRSLTAEQAVALALDSAK